MDLDKSLRVNIDSKLGRCAYLLLTVPLAGTVAVISVAGLTVWSTLKALVQIPAYGLLMTGTLLVKLVQDNLQEVE